VRTRKDKEGEDKEGRQRAVSEEVAGEITAV
jgi:hypothetical protein